MKTGVGKRPNLLASEDLPADQFPQQLPGARSGVDIPGLAISGACFPKPFICPKRN